jgi:hypothetical protein
MESGHEAQVFGQGLNFFHFENLPGSHAVIETILRVTGAYWRGRANAAKVKLLRNEVASARLPAAFDGYTILHLSDLHTDMSGPAMKRVGELVAGLRYDLCVLTGDYLGLTYGPYRPSLKGLAELRHALSGEVYGVLGNHDTILMAPDIERMGVRLLVNEHVAIGRGAARVLCGRRRRAFLSRRRRREGGGGNPPRGVFHPAVPHAGNLPSGGSRRV